MALNANVVVLKGRIIAYYLNGVDFGWMQKPVLKGRIIAYYLNYQSIRVSQRVSLRVELLLII